jgi:hypothetical protein
METKEIKPKTLVTVLTAAIKEDAECIAQKIVEKVKGDNVEYTSLVETFILNKRDSEKITFSTFAENEFEQIKDVEALKDFSVELVCYWRKKGEPERFFYENKNEFTVKSNLNITVENYWDKSAHAYGNNAFSVFEEFKETLQKKLLSINCVSTEVNLPEEK